MVILIHTDTYSYLQLDDDNKVKDLENQVMEFRKQIEKALESTKKKSFYSKYGEEEGIYAFVKFLYVHVLFKKFIRNKKSNCEIFILIS